jgi:CO/xanthine dehydrogenase Mo-binding subunit
MPLDTHFTNQKFKQVGTRPLRPDGVDKVTGRAKYGADYNAPGQLSLCWARPMPTPHQASTSKAEKLAGVKAVITSATPDHRW